MFDLIVNQIQGGDTHEYTNNTRQYFVRVWNRDRVFVQLNKLILETLYYTCPNGKYAHWVTLSSIINTNGPICNTQLVL